MGTFYQRLLTRWENIGTCFVKYSQVLYARILLDPPPSSGYNFTKISGSGEGQDSLLMGQYGQLGKVVDLFDGKKKGFFIEAGALDVGFDNMTMTSIFLVCRRTIEQHFDVWIAPPMDRATRWSKPIYLSSTVGEKKKVCKKSATDLSKKAKSQWLLFQGALCQCVSLHPEVSDECEVWGDGGSGHQRDAGQGWQQRQVAWQQQVQECSSGNCGGRALPPSLHPAGRLGLSHGWLLQLGRRGGWTGHPTNNSLASGQYCSHREPSLQACHPNFTQLFERLTSGWCWLNFPTLTRRLCWKWWPGLGMTTPLT